MSEASFHPVPQRFAVQFDVCKALIQRRLRGFRGAPRSDDDWDTFAEDLQAVAVSVEHVQACLQRFDEEMPTIRQLRDVAMNLRPRFEATPDRVAQWRRDYGKAEPLSTNPADELAMHWQAFRDVLYYSEGPGERKPFWEAALMRDEKMHPESLAFVRRQVVRIGWAAIMKLSASPEPMPYTKPNYRRIAALAPAGAPITQADMDRASAFRKSAADVDNELDGWDDADR